MSAEELEPEADWRDRAACLDEYPELFFPIGEKTRGDILWIEEAKIVCRTCEVREQCLQWALENGQDHGVWGGLSESERRDLKRKNSHRRVRTTAAAAMGSTVVTAHISQQERGPS